MTSDDDQMRPKHTTQKPNKHQITMLVEDVIDILEAQFESEIPSRAIGDAVMERLRRIDQVAYVRFASIYKQFRDVAEFMQEINALDKPKQ